MLLPLEKLEAGMEISSDVVDATGRLLMPSGGILSERHIRACKNWGVLLVDVAGCD